jgi:hypothetical protein
MLKTRAKLSPTALLMALALAAGGLALEAGEAGAYTIKVRNAMPTNGNGVAVKLSWGLADFSSDWHYSDTLAPGQTYERSYGGWQAGVCFQQLAWKINRELPGCDAGNLSGKWHEFKKGMVCRSADVVIRRNGCNVEASW